MYLLENDFLKIEIASLGAELQSIFSKKHGMEFMWDAGPAWPKKSPVLFPIIGSLKDQTYYYQGKPYHLNRHGFAREMDFAVTDQTSNLVCFTLSPPGKVFEIYPFKFRFDVIYTLQDKQLAVTYRVVNKGNAGEKLYFSVGGHPAFKLPVLPGTEYTDYKLLFNKTENTGRWPITSDGLIADGPVTILNNSKALRLAKELFFTDAIVLKDLNSTRVKLNSEKAGDLFEFDFTGFPYLGIWAAKNADFVCIEPWCGIADSVHSNQQITDKEGINVLDSTEQFERTWKLTIF